MTWHQGPAKSWVNIFWGSSSLSGTMLVLAPPGAVPAVGGYLYPSVLRSPGATPQKCRAAHGPRHPAVTIPLRLCMLGVCFVCLMFLGYLYVFCVGCMVFGVEMLFGLVPFKTSPLFALVFVVLSFFSFCWDVRRRRFCLCLSLSQALGKSKPRLGFGFPLVLSSSRTRSTSSIRTPCSAYTSRHRSSSCVFFFFSRRRSRGLCSGLGFAVLSWLGWWWWSLRELAEDILASLLGAEGLDILRPF